MPDEAHDVTLETLTQQLEALKRRNLLLEQELVETKAQLAQSQLRQSYVTSLHVAHDRDLLLHRITHDMQDIFWLASCEWSATAPRFSVTFTNPVVEAITGYSSEEIARDPEIWQRITHPDDAARLLAAIQAHLLHGVDIEYRIIHKSGAIRWVQTRIHPLRDPHGDMLELVGLTSDVTRRYTAEEWLRLHNNVLDAIGQAVVVMETTGRVVYWNRAAETTFGWTRDEVIGRSVFGAPESERMRAHSIQILEAIITHGQWDGEVVQYRKDDTSLPILVTGQLLRDENGKDRFIVLIATDISRQKQTEDALRQSEADYRQLNADLELRVNQRTTDLRLANHMLAREIADRELAEKQLRFQAMLLAAVGQAVVAVDTRLSIIYWGSAAERMFGWNAVEANRLPASVLLPAQPGDDAILPFANSIMDSGQVWEGEFLLRRRDGSSFPVLGAIAPFYDEQRQLAGLIGIISDITERQRARQELADANHRLNLLNTDLQLSRDLLRTIVDNLDDALALVDGGGALLMVNQRFAEMLNCTPTEIIGRLCAEAYPQIASIVAGALESDKHTHALIRAEGDGGAPLIIDIFCIPLRNQSSEQRMVLRMVDVTERLQLEEIMLQNERLAATSRLAAIMAHEVNTPLQSIQNYLYLLRTTKAQRQQSYLALLGEELDRVSALMRRLLDIHRPSAGALELIDLNLLVERVLLLMGSTLARSGIWVERWLAPGLPPLNGERDTLTQVLFNLILNAVDAMPQGGKLRVVTAGVGDAALPEMQRYLQLKVQDSGIGIAPDLQEHIFEPFFTTKRQGSGLGLAISKQIIEQHGGRLSVSSMSGVGTTFEILLPLADVAAAHEDHGS